jgi:hypothetical protein
MDDQSLQTKASLLQQELELENARYKQAIKTNKEFSEARKIRGRISFLEQESESIKDKLQQQEA